MTEVDDHQLLVVKSRSAAGRLSQCRGKLAACSERLEALERGGKGDVAKHLRHSHSFSFIELND